MKTNKLQQIIIDEDDIIDVFYREDQLGRITVDEPGWVERLNRNLALYELPTIAWDRESELSEDEFVRDNLADWHLPEMYQEFDLENYLLSKCENIEQTQRVQEELEEFKKRDMLIVLKWLKYFVDTMRENNLVWGVGRGSSVASYVLYLLEVHRVDSIAYELDIKEFLK